ncbi:hypothetical protein ACSS6W_009703 [Trichoderma asperelloides]|uniref:CHAT domain-containing protein n=1 Tax=Trichoderma asperellum TaxID=101201 RepID=A0A6V8R6L8_TRIAP|nr:hypothetical protein TASIC1_0014015800 [Trichoderma asperellum]
MDVVHVRWHAGEPQEVADATAESAAIPEVTGTSGIEAIFDIAGAPGIAATKRTWKVTVQANGRPSFVTTITDPFLEAEYKDVFEDYLRNSDQQHWSLQSLELEDGRDDISRAEDRIQAYGEMLLGEIGLFRPGLLRAEIREVQLVIAEHHDYASSEEGVRGGIHCLAWELLEAVNHPLRPNLHLKVTRVSDFDFAGQPHRPLGPPRSLSSVQASVNGVFHVLLVIARDFSRRGAARDPEPDLAQWPLMSVQKKLKSRMLLEVVRPGSIEELDEHLKVRAGHGVVFNLVHFDLHGRIMRDEYGNQVPGLLFAKGYQASSPHRHAVPPTHLARATDVAKVLAECRVENVVLNACLSAYNRTGPTTNLAHIFLEHGILNVSAMWFYVHWKTVTTYLGAFYNELLIKGTDFHLAAQRGRDAIRKNPTCRTGKAYEDSFLCVNYTRKFSKTGAVQRESSPTPSTHSADSSTSTTSMKSFMSGKWRGSPRLSDSFLVADEPIMRLELHLLELEYKLMTSRVVYASDLRKASDSDLNVTIERMVSMWLNTNLIDEVFYYKAKDFAKPRFLAGTVSHREKRTRASNGGYLQLLFPRPVRALRQTLHIIRDVDPVVDPGTQADPLENQRNEDRRVLVERGLQRFAERLHEEGHSYMLFIGSRDAQWWREHLQHLSGEWWLNMAWKYTVHSRYVRDVTLLAGNRREVPRTLQ